MTSSKTPRASRRTPTAEQLRAWRGYIETADALRAALATQLQRDSDLSTGDYTVLLALSEAADHRLRSSQLAAQINWQRSRLSHHLARMQRRGLIARQDCATDNRGADVVLTTAGADAFHAATLPHLDAIRELFVDALTPDQLAAAADIATALRAHLRDARQRSQEHENPGSPGHSSVPLRGFEPRFPP